MWVGGWGGAHLSHDLIVASRVRRSLNLLSSSTPNSPPTPRCERGEQRGRWSMGRRVEGLEARAGSRKGGSEYMAGWGRMGKEGCQEEWTG